MGTIETNDFANGEVCKPDPELFESDEVGKNDGL